MFPLMLTIATALVLLSFLFAFLGRKSIQKFGENSGLAFLMVLLMCFFFFGGAIFAFGGVIELSAYREMAEKQARLSDENCVVIAEGIYDHLEYASRASDGKGLIVDGNDNYTVFYFDNGRAYLINGHWKEYNFVKGERIGIFGNQHGERKVKRILNK